MIVARMRVHNEFEAKALIREIEQTGIPEDYHHTEWVTHNGEFLGWSYCENQNWPAGGVLRFQECKRGES